MGGFRGIRTIKNGRVKVRGRVYVPDDPHCAYNGELDGQRYRFHGYEPGDYMLNMWGSEDYFSSREPLEAQPHISKEGFIRWMFWKPIEVDAQEVGA